jgi:UDPglucose 6-dehydrogenase
MVNSIGVMGLGFVGGTIQKVMESFGLKVKVYDKYKDIGRVEDMNGTDLVFLALPTPFDTKTMGYDKKELYLALQELQNLKYYHPIVIKSTVEPGFTQDCANRFRMNLLHNPEFLTARTAEHDFRNQERIFIGRTSSILIYDQVLTDLYKAHFPSAEIIHATATETEAVKLFCNNFYATKVQFFTEIHQLCKGLNLSYERVRELMIRQPWVGKNHTQVPGHDGQISYGGHCFPKDTEALAAMMDAHNIPNTMIRAMVNERNTMREDHINVIR